MGQLKFNPSLPTQPQESELFTAHFPIACSETRGGRVIIVDKQFSNGAEQFPFLSSAGSVLGLLEMERGTELEAEPLGYDFHAQDIESEDQFSIALRESGIRVRRHTDLEVTRSISGDSPSSFTGVPAGYGRLVFIAPDGESLSISGQDQIDTFGLPERLRHSTILGAGYTDTGLLVALLPLDPAVVQSRTERSKHFAPLAHKYRAVLLRISAEEKVNILGSFSTANYGPVQFSADGETALHLQHSSKAGTLVGEVAAVSSNSLTTLRRFEVTAADRLRLLHLSANGRFLVTCSALEKHQSLRIYDLTKPAVPAIVEASIERPISVLRFVGERSLIVGMLGAKVMRAQSKIGLVSRMDF